METEKKEDYDFKIEEARIRDLWEKEGIFKVNLKKKGNIYSIDTPPPYISGKMHIGHAFSYSQQDFVARYKRMKGFNVFYPFGTDDNGLPTERFVERVNNVKSNSMERSKFIDLCLKTIKETSGALIQDWKDIGLSADFNMYYSTIDKFTQKISQESFLELYKKGEAYVKEFPTLYCVECRTAIAQAELEDKEQASLFSTLKFSCQGKDLLIATTRPELLQACVAVFVNPNDKRYKHLVGKKAKVPIFNHEVPIIADESAQIDKGTGVLMVCSYGDKYDAEAIARHKLTGKIILNTNGEIISGDYKGMKIKEARKKILEDLKNKNLIEKQEQINHTVNVHERCGTEIEIIPTEQWFIKILDKKKKLIENGKKIRWYPEFMRKRYENWVDGLCWDWNISRNRHFGVPIPIWKCKKCNEIIVAEQKELPVDPTRTKKTCKKCKSEAEGEKMVFDTWQTSSLTPQIASELVKNEVKIPFSLRPQGHDIIRTWAFYTIVKSLLHENNIPWKEIMVSGNVSLGGEKMSKSKGNIVEPQPIIQNYGADSLRYWAASSKLGEDLDYQEKEILAGKKFVTKIWNATKFVFQNMEKVEKAELEETDRLLLVRLNKAIKEASESFENYEYARAKTETTNFFWSDFCDNYLEIVKNRIYNGTEKEKNSARYVLYHALLSVIKMMAPITPYITEALYQKFFRISEGEKSVHISSWPEKFKIKTSKDDDETWKLLIEVLTSVRMMKSKAQKSMRAEIILTLEKDKQKKLDKILGDLKSVTSTKEIKTGEFRVEFV